MKQPSFKGTIKLTPKYSKCDPIYITGEWRYDEKINRWICNNATPHCYNGVPLSGDCCEIVKVIEQMKYPKYVKTADGYIGTFVSLDFGEFPVYRFEGGDRIADNWELQHGSDNKEDLLK